MLTIFSIPKPFNGHIDIIQRNAIQSWLKLEPRCEIFLCGNDRGVAEVAQEFNVHHIPNIEENEFGTPLLSSAFRIVQQEAANALVCYVNADIIMLNNVIDAARLVPFKRFLLLGQRWNLDIKNPIDYAQPSWIEDVRVKLADQGELQPPFGSDYFIFPKDINWGLPEFAVGRPGWDNWLIYRARALQIPVIDATEAGTVVHQNHNYAHVPGSSDPSTFEGPEAVRNRSLMGKEDYSFNIGDSTYRIMDKSIKKAKDYQYLKYRIVRQSILFPSKGAIWKSIWRFLQALLYRRRYLPNWFWQNLIHSLTK
jgi:hypothetical protein